LLISNPAFSPFSHHKPLEQASDHQVVEIKSDLHDENSGFYPRGPISSISCLLVYFADEIENNFVHPDPALPKASYISTGLKASALTSMLFFKSLG